MGNSADTNTAMFSRRSALGGSQWPGQRLGTYRYTASSSQLSQGLSIGSKRWLQEGQTTVFEFVSVSATRKRRLQPTWPHSGQRRTNGGIISGSVPMVPQLICWICKALVERW